MSFAVLEPPEPSALTVVPVAPPCLDAPDDDAMEEEWLEDQMQDLLEIDHAEAAMTDEPGCEPKLVIGRFGCVAVDHTVPLLRAAQRRPRDGARGARHQAARVAPGRLHGGSALPPRGRPQVCPDLPYQAEATIVTCTLSLCMG